MPKKKFNPQEGIVQIPYEKEIVSFVDAVIDKNNKAGSHLFVQGSQDWDTIAFIYKGFSVLYPEDAADFEKHMHDVHQDTKWNHGISKEGDAMVEHILEIPMKLYKMIMAVFPDQKWDGKFARKFKGHFPQMAGHL